MFAMETKTYRTDEEVAALADLCCAGYNDEIKSKRLSALYSQYGTCIDELIEKTIAKQQNFVKCPVCERDPNCLCCNGEGQITKFKYNKISQVIGKFH